MRKWQHWWKTETRVYGEDRQMNRKADFFCLSSFFIKGPQLFHIFRNFLSKWQGNPQVTALADFTLNLNSKTQSSHLINVQRLYKWIFLIRIKKKRINTETDWFIQQHNIYSNLHLIQCMCVCMEGSKLT